MENQPSSEDLYRRIGSDLHELTEKIANFPAYTGTPEPSPFRAILKALLIFQSM
jgi:hypothetical protein